MNITSALLGYHAILVIVVVRGQHSFLGLLVTSLL